MYSLPAVLYDSFVLPCRFFAVPLLPLHFAFTTPYHTPDFTTSPPLRFFAHILYRFFLPFTFHPTPCIPLFYILPPLVYLPYLLVTTYTHTPFYYIPQQLPPRSYHHYAFTIYGITVYFFYVSFVPPLRFFLLFPFFG